MAFAQHGATSTLAAAGTYPWTADDQCCTAAGSFSLVADLFFVDGDSSWGDELPASSSSLIFYDILTCSLQILAYFS